MRQRVPFLHSQSSHGGRLYSPHRRGKDSSPSSRSSSEGVLPATLRYDLSKIAQQALSDVALRIYQQMSAAVLGRVLPKRRENFEEAVLAFHQALDFSDRVVRFAPPQSQVATWVRTAEEFFVGPRAGEENDLPRSSSISYSQNISSASDKKLARANALVQITSWAEPTTNNTLDDYAYKLWGGLIAEYYRPRWETFFDFVREGWDEGPIDPEKANDAVLAWQHRWWTNVTGNSCSTIHPECPTPARNEEKSLKKIVLDEDGALVSLAERISDFVAQHRDKSGPLLLRRESGENVLKEDVVFA